MADAVCIALDRGESPIRIARNLKLRPNTIHKIRRRYEQATGMKIARKGRPGRPRKEAA